jgi:hypothetical protein
MNSWGTIGKKGGILFQIEIMSNIVLKDSEIKISKQIHQRW